MLPTALNDCETSLLFHKYYVYDDRMMAHKHAFMFNNYNILCMFRSINYN